MIEDTRVRIVWDTNVFVRAILFNTPELLDYLDHLLFQQQLGLIEFVVPKAVEAELYGILRAGRVKNKTLTHEEIIELFSPYPECFESDFLEQLNRYEWPQGVGYKDVLYEVLKNEYGWDDWGKSIIEQKLGYSTEYLGLKDIHDLPIMAAALQFGVDLLVTVNMQDFIDPLGKIRVMDAYEAKAFPHNIELRVDGKEFDPPL